MPATRTVIQLNNPNKTFRNGFKDSATLGPLRLQWGQDVCDTDGALAVAFQQPFVSACYAVLTTPSMPNARSSLAVGASSKSGFQIDRSDDIDGPCPFYWFAIGDAASPVPVGSYDLDAATAIFWGSADSTGDEGQEFKVPRTLKPGPSAVLTTAATGGVRWALAVSAFTPSSGALRINRDDTINGTVKFHYFGIGGASASAPNSSSAAVLARDGIKLQWGRAVTTSDYEQLFLLPEYFADMNFAVLTTVADADVMACAPLTRPINSGSFIVDRSSKFDGDRPFYWLAIGR